MAIGLDTSVVVRLLVGLPERQARAARSRLERAVEEQETVFVSDLVLAEAYFALHHHHEVPKNEARRLLGRLAGSGVVRVDPPLPVSVFEDMRGAGFVDRLIHARYRKLDADTLTFERRQGSLEGAIRLPGN